MRCSKITVPVDIPGKDQNKQKRGFQLGEALNVVAVVSIPNHAERRYGMKQTLAYVLMWFRMLGPDAVRRIGPLGRSVHFLGTVDVLRKGLGAQARLSAKLCAIRVFPCMRRENLMLKSLSISLIYVLRASAGGPVVVSRVAVEYKASSRLGQKPVPQAGTGIRGWCITRLRFSCGPSC
jgi:hypothetical protein